MPPPKNKQKLSREEVLKNKIEAQKVRLLSIKSDPIKLAENKEKTKVNDTSATADSKK